MNVRRRQTVQHLLLLLMMVVVMRVMRRRIDSDRRRLVAAMSRDGRRLLRLGRRRRLIMARPHRRGRVIYVSTVFVAESARRSAPERARLPIKLYIMHSIIQCRDECVSTYSRGGHNENGASACGDGSV